MPQHDYDIANQTFPNTRADINNALEAIATNNEGTTAPSTTYAYQWWYDTTNDILKMRNGANDGWINILSLDQTDDVIESFSIGTSASINTLTMFQSTNAGARFQNSSTGTGTSDGLYVGNVASSSAAIVSQGENDDLRFATDSTDRVFIKGGGSVRVNQNTTDTPGLSNTTAGVAFENLVGGPGGLFVSRASGTALNLNVNADANAIAFNRSGSTVGSVSITSSATSYNTSSDRRLKSNIRDITADSGSIIDNLKPRTFTMGGVEKHGFIADEFQEEFPLSVTGEKDGVDEQGNPVYQSMSASNPETIAVLVAEIQSLRQRVAELEAGNG